MKNFNFKHHGFEMKENQITGDILVRVENIDLEVVCEVKDRNIDFGVMDKEISLEVIKVNRLRKSVERGL